MDVDYHIYLVTCLFIIMDIITGTTQASKNKTLSSQKMREGIDHKIGYVIIVITSAMLEYAITYLDLGFTAPLIIPTCVMIVLTETISILENAEKINPELSQAPIFSLLANNKKRRSDD